MSGAAPRLLLASGSPRRRKILSDAGFEFEVIVPQVEEIVGRGLTLREITLCNALRKGLAGARAQPHAVILAADTLVALEGAVMGKPVDRADAKRILMRLSGREHTVATGVFIGHLASGYTKMLASFSQVLFKRWDGNRIDNYLRKINPLDKAGAYAAQGRGGEIIARIVGLKSNVIGLPLEEIQPVLARLGILPNESPQPRVRRRRGVRVSRGAGPDKETRR